MAALAGLLPDVLGSWAFVAFIWVTGAMGARPGKDAR